MQTRWTGNACPCCAPLVHWISRSESWQLAALGAVVVVITLSLARRRLDGRKRADPSRVVVSGTDIGAPLGVRGTLVQISSDFCHPSRVSRRVLAEAAVSYPGVEHIDLDAEEHLALVSRLAVTRTPTVLVLDRAGLVVSRITGPPMPEHVSEVLGRLAAAPGTEPALRR